MHHRARVPGQPLQQKLSKLVSQRRNHLVLCSQHWASALGCSRLVVMAVMVLSLGTRNHSLHPGTRYLAHIRLTIVFVPSPRLSSYLLHTYTPSCPSTSTLSVLDWPTHLHFPNPARRGRCCHCLREISDVDSDSSHILQCLALPITAPHPSHADPMA